MKKILKKIPTGVLSVLSMALIAYLSLDNDPFNSSSMKLFPGADKIAHVVLYFCLGAVFLFDYMTHRHPRSPKTDKVCVFAFAAFVYGVVMELLQGYMGRGRDVSMADMFANLLGAVLAFCFMKYFFFGWIRKKLNYKKKYF